MKSLEIVRLYLGYRSTRAIFLQPASGDELEREVTALESTLMKIFLPLTGKVVSIVGSFPTKPLDLARHSLSSAVNVILALLIFASSSWAAEPFYQSELVVPLENFHNHASCILELPKGELLVAWYHGSGEHEANDVKIVGARKAKGDRAWNRRFVMADTANFPDGNPIIFLDGKRQLWLVWPVIVANDWRTTVLKYLIAADYQRPQRPPKWKSGDTLLNAPKGFTVEVRRSLDQFVKVNPATAGSQRVEVLKTMTGDKYASRMGWITRSRPLILSTGRILLPIYSDGFSLSMMAISDDGGNSWVWSKPIIGLGNIQPSIVRRNDGTLVAYMRNAGPPPRRLYVSTSNDAGVTWSFATHTNLPNPGSAADVTRLASGHWALVYNDTEAGRHSLAVSISDNEGQSWRWTRHLERDERGAGAGQFHYPSIIQTRDGLVHVTYSYFLEHLPEGAPRKAIKHAAFNLEWVKAGAMNQLSKEP